MDTKEEQDDEVVDKDYVSVFLDEASSLDGHKHCYDFTQEEYSKLEPEKEFPKGWDEYHIGVNKNGIIVDNDFDAIWDKPFAEVYPDFHDKDHTFVLKRMEDKVAGFSVYYDNFKENYFAKMQEDLKQGLTEEAYESRDDSLYAGCDNFYVQDESLHNANIWPMCYDGKVKLGYYCPADSDNYEVTDAKYITPEFLKHCSFEEFKTAVLEKEIPALVKTGVLDLAIRSAPNKLDTPFLHAKTSEEVGKLPNGYLVDIHVAPQKERSIEMAYLDVMKTLRNMGWTFSQVDERNGAFFASKINNHLECNQKGKNLHLTGTLQYGSIYDTLNWLKEDSQKDFTLQEVKKGEKVYTFSDREFIDYYSKIAPQIDMLLQRAVRDGYTEFPEEKVMMDKPRLFLADQYTGTSLEGKRLKSFLHQELQTMKRFGLVKENEQGKLSVGSSVNQVSEKLNSSSL